MNRRAIVVHADEAMSRLASSGLRVFRPGFEVATAQTLSHATNWLGGKPLDLVVVELNGHDPSHIAEWAEENHVDVGDIVLVGADQSKSSGLGFGGDLPAPFGLSALLALVRRMDKAKGSR